MEATGLPKWLHAAIALFAAKHPEYAQHDAAHDKCGEASVKFADLLRERGYRGQLDIEELAIIDGVSHRGVFVVGLWIDWTARQYIADAPFPLVGKKSWPYADALRERGIDVYGEG